MFLVLGAITFWVSWLLMPDPGTTDTKHILEIVKQSRTAVIWSVTIQILSSVLYAIGLLVLVRTINTQKKTFTGVLLFAIGSMGLCADAFFHLLAWFMTDNSVTIQEDVVRIMDFMQQEALILLIPILLPLFFGAWIMASGLRIQLLVSKLPAYIIAASFIIGIASAIAGNIQGGSLPVPIIATLGIFAAGQVLTGYELIKRDTAITK